MPSPEALARRVHELETVVDAVRAITSSLDLADVLRAILGRIKALTQAEALSLLLHDPSRDELVFAATETLRENTLVGVPDPTPAAIEPAGSVCTVPLERDGRPLGAVVLRVPFDGRPFDGAARRRAADAAREIAATLDPERLAQDRAAMAAVFARLAAAVPCETTELRLRDPAGNQLALRATRALQPGVIDGLRLPMGQGIAGWVAAHRTSLRLDDASADPRHDPTVAGRTGLRPRSMLCVPLVKQGALLGVIQVINRFDGRPFTDDELHLVELLAEHAALALDNAALYRRAHVAARTDDLTGLGNTRSFNEVLPALLARVRPVSLLVADLDHFKEVVDRYGHLVGSATIAHLGGLIGGLLRPGDVAARFGGDEFVVVLPETATADALRMGEAVRAAIEGCRRPGALDVDVSGITASIGVATYPEHAADADGLFRAADGAMYAVKRSGRNGVALSTTALTSA